MPVYLPHASSRQGGRGSDLGPVPADEEGGGEGRGGQVGQYQAEQLGWQAVDVTDTPDPTRIIRHLLSTDRARQQNLLMVRLTKVFVILYFLVFNEYTGQRWRHILYSKID